MTWKSRLKTAGALAALGSALLAVVSVRHELEPVAHLSGAAYSVAAVLGAGILVIAGLIVVVGSFTTLPAAVDYTCERADKSDLRVVQKFAKTVLDAEIMSLDVLRAWYGRNPNLIHLVFKDTSRHFSWGRELVGFFAVVPVTASGKALLTQNRLHGSLSMLKHIAREREKAEAFYISGVGANGYRARERTLMFLSGYLTSLTETVTPLVFTKPATPDGLRLAKRRGFKPVEKETPVPETVFFRDFS